LIVSSFGYALIVSVRSLARIIGVSINTSSLRSSLRAYEFVIKHRSYDMTDTKYIAYRDPDTFHIVVTEYRDSLVRFLNANDFLWEYTTHEHYLEVQAEHADAKAHGEQFLRYNCPDRY
jgi:hypothetical protein